MKKILLFLCFLLPLLTQATIVNVGTGSGGLEIDHTNYTINPGDTVIIAPGIYDWVYINLQGTDGNPIVVKNGDGLVDCGARLDFSTPRNIIVSGDGKAGLEYGFYVHGYYYKGTVIEFSSASYRNFTLQYVMYEDIGDYCIDFRDEFDYDSGDESNTVHQDVKLLHLYFRNTSMINLRGTFNESENKALYRNLEVAYCIWESCPWADHTVFLGNGQNYSIHHNLIDSFNLEYPYNTTVFALNGYGDFYNNKSTNYKGYAVRCWLYTIGNTKAVANFYNNIAWNSLTNSAFWMAASEGQIITDVSVGVDCNFYNNTAGKLNTSEDGRGCLLDKNDMYGGYLTVKNNIVYDSYINGGEEHIINAGDRSDEDVSNNIYYSDFTETGLDDEISFKPVTGSLLIAAGTPIGLVTNDYYGNARPNPPAIGAVEPEVDTSTHRGFFIVYPKIHKKP